MRTVLLLLILVCGFSLSQTTEKENEDKKAVTNKGADKRSCGNAPSVVTTVAGNPCKASNEEPEPSWWHKLWFDPIATFTGALFLATAALIGTGIVQWRATRNVAKKQLRAY